MTQSHKHHHSSTGLHPRPREFLKEAENAAVRIRKDLRQIELTQDVEGASVSAHDALAIAKLIIDICRFGRIAQAEDAIMAVEQVEVLLDLLGIEIDLILACSTYRAL